MRPDEIESLTGEIEPDLIHEIRCPIKLERPGGYREMLQQPSLELQLFVGLGKLPRSFGDAPLDFICNPLFLIQAGCLLEPDGQPIRSYSKLQAKVLTFEAIIQTLAPASIVRTVEGISQRSMNCGLLVWDRSLEYRWGGFFGKVD